MKPFTQAQALADWIASVNAPVCTLYTNEHGIYHVEGSPSPSGSAPIGWEFTLANVDGEKSSDWWLS